MIKKLKCFFSKKGHKISTHNRRCLKCGKYIPSRQLIQEDVYKIENK
jgi:hypothetical protein